MGPEVVPAGGKEHPPKGWAWPQGSAQAKIRGQGQGQIEGEVEGEWPSPPEFLMAPEDSVKGSGEDRSVPHVQQKLAELTLTPEGAVPQVTGKEKGVREVDQY